MLSARFFLSYHPCEPSRLHLAQVDHGNGQPVGHGPELLHHVKRKTGLTRTIAVQIANSRIKAGTFQGGTNVMEHQCIQEREQAIHPVQRWPAITLMENKVLFIPDDKMIKHPKIYMGCITFHSPHLIKVELSL